MAGFATIFLVPEQKVFEAIVKLTPSLDPKFDCQM